MFIECEDCPCKDNCLLYEHPALPDEDILPPSNGTLKISPDRYFKPLALLHQEYLPQGASCGAKIAAASITEQLRTALAPLMLVIDQPGYAHLRSTLQRLFEIAQKNSTLSQLPPEEVFSRLPGTDMTVLTTHEHAADKLIDINSTHLDPKLTTSENQLT